MRGKMGWGPWCLVWAKKLPASQPLRVWPGTALSRVLWGLSKAHHGEEAVSVGMLRGCQGTAGGETGDPAQQFGHNEVENSYSFYKTYLVCWAERFVRSFSNIFLFNLNDKKAPNDRTIFCFCAAGVKTLRTPRRSGEWAQHSSLIPVCRMMFMLHFGLESGVLQQQ